MLTLMFRLLRVDEVELFVSAASTKGGWMYISGDMTYTLGLDDPLNEGATCSSAVRDDEQRNMSTHADHHVHKFLGFGMARRFAVCGHVLFVGFGSLENMFRYRKMKTRRRNKGIRTS